jgi:N,N'-diacetyllegionaminate synthase
MTTNLKIIAEIASAHEGNLDLLKHLLISSKQTGANFVKLQIYKFKELVHVVKGEKYNLQRNEISKTDWEKIISFSKDNSIQLIIEPYDLESFDITKSQEAVVGYKVPTADINNKELIQHIAAEGKDIYLGIGGAYEEEINDALEIITRNDYQNIVLMHGIQSFPTKVEDCLLYKIPHLRKRYNLDIGYADHIDADNKIMSFTVPAIAVAMGANVIEKHITKDRAAKSFDYYSALNPHEFSEFVEFINMASQSIGSDCGDELNLAEIEYRNKMKKFAILNNDVCIGDSLSHADVCFKRVNLPGISRSDFTNMQDAKFNKNLKSGQPILREYLDE